MGREFAVPPVVFPSYGNPSVVNIQKRRFPTAPFQPTRAANPSIPFMSFDVGSVTTAPNSSVSTLYGGPIGGGNNTIFEAEEPLLDELGIHPDQIRRKTLSILNPVRVDAHPHTDSDLSGPVLYYVAFSLFQLLAGKIQFGVILGWIVISSMFLYVVFNMLAGRTGNLDLHRCTSIVGYCILPVTVLSALSLCLPAGGMVSFVLAGLFVLWSTRVCTSLLVQSCPDGGEHGGLIAVYLQMDTPNPAVFVNADLLRLYVGRKVGAVIQVVRAEGGFIIGKSTDEQQLVIKGNPPSFPLATFVEVIGIAEGNQSIRAETWTNLGDTFDTYAYNQLCQTCKWGI